MQYRELADNRYMNNVNKMKLEERLKLSHTCAEECGHDFRDECPQCKNCERCNAEDHEQWLMDSNIGAFGAI